MFEHFIFGAQPQTLASLEEAQPSPRDNSSPLPSTYSEYHQQAASQSGAIIELVKNFHNQNLTPGNEYPHSLPSPPFEIDDNLDHDGHLAQFNISSAPSTPISQPMSAKARGQTITCRRLQRQLNVQLQSCTKHARDISILVDRMVAAKSQCSVSSRSYKAASLRPQTVPIPFIDVDLSNSTQYGELEVDEDEGFVDGDYTDEDIMSVRRASAPSGIRKNGLVKWRSSAESVGHAKVYNVPRMRRRRPARR